MKKCGKGLHDMTPENSKPHSDGSPRCRACIAAWYAARPGYVTSHVQKYRSDPENREKERERSRRWKEKNRERNRARDREYHRRRRAEAVASTEGGPRWMS